MARDLKQFQREMALHYYLLPEEKKEELRREFLAANPQKKDFDFSIDGVRGSTTKFFEKLFSAGEGKQILLNFRGRGGSVNEESEIVPLPSGSVPAEKSKELADFFNKYGPHKEDGEPYTCAGCISLSEDKWAGMTRSIARHGTPEMASNLMGLFRHTEGRVGEMQKVYAEERGKLNPQQPVVKTTAELPSEEISAKKIDGFIERVKFAGVAGAYGVAQTGGAALVTPYGQVGGRIDLTDNMQINLSGSLRPETTAGGIVSEPNPYLLSLNLEQRLKNGVGLEYGVSPYITSHIYSKDPWEQGEALTDCGCTINADDNNLTLSDGIFSPWLRETAMAGVKVSKTTDDTYVYAGVGVPLQSQNLEKLKPAAIAGVARKLNDDHSVGANIAVQEKQVSGSVGSTHRLGEKTKLKTNVFGDYGEHRKVAGAEVRLEHEINEKTKAAVTGGFQRDFETNENGWNVRGAVERKISDKWSAGVFVMHGQEGKKDNTVGGIGFGFKF